MFRTWLIFVAIYTLDVVPLKAKEVTNEDIKDAILSLVHIVRAADDKQERHEFRERQLGEQLKKGLAGLSKKQYSFEPIKETLSRLDERLANVETILIQKDERERIQLQKSNNTIQEIQTTLSNWMTIMEAKIKQTVAQKPEIKPNDLQKDDLLKIQTDLTKKIDKVLSNVNHLQSEITRFHEDNQNIKDLHEKLAKNIGQVDDKLKSNEVLLGKSETHLSELNNKILHAATHPIVNESNPDWHATFLTAIEIQRTHLEQILSDLKAVESKIHKLPASTDYDQKHNFTLDKLQEIRYELNTKLDNSSVKSDTQFKDIDEKLSHNHEELTKVVENIGELSKNVYRDVAKNYEQLRNDVQALSKIEKAIIQTTDNVLDTKSRLEYGVLQILEVGNLVKSNSKELNSTLNERFDNMELIILEDQTGAIVNLTTKLEQDMLLVWRQIGSMYQELTASKTSLDRLQEQTETYVNGSLSTMDNIEGKIGQITRRMAEVDENLYYLLGRLSSVAQAFNQIKTGLGQALDNIRSSFQIVQDKIKDSGPGPHKIEDPPQP